MLDEEEVLKETEVFKHLFMALQDFIEKDIKVDFEAGETLVHRYGKQQNTWITHAAPLVIPERKYLIPVLKDELLLSRIAKQKNTGTDIEMDIAYVNSTIRDKRYERPIAIRSCILADSRTEMVIDQYLLTPEDDEVQYGFRYGNQLYFKYRKAQKDFCKR
ncbi:hypothetical protein TheetDRAFT_2182 [Thermoanaerobacter ethanolicus JW 200]|nr:hypothetical protein [Thermoanaerobacter indiensis]EGD50994.1 hypothetical protein TheetDRAFT_2182 [Thermoanaerobacter ethanolicus JW 200]